MKYDPTMFVWNGVPTSFKEITIRLSTLLQFLVFARTAELVKISRSSDFLITLPVGFIYL